MSTSELLARANRLFRNAIYNGRDEDTIGTIRKFIWYTVEIQVSAELAGEIYQCQPKSSK